MAKHSRLEGFLPRLNSLSVVFLSSHSGHCQSRSSSRRVAFNQTASANWNWADWGEFALAVTFVVFIVGLLDWCPFRNWQPKKQLYLRGEEQVGVQALKPLLSGEPTDGAGMMSVQLGMSPWHCTPSLDVPSSEQPD